MKLSRPLALIVAASVACLIGAVLVVDRFGGEGFFIELTGGFAGALVAFVLALEWENSRERSRLAQGAEELTKQRETEVKRRFETVRRELRANRESLEFLKRELVPDATVRPLHPQLLEGAWSASAARLTELVSVYDLTAALAVAYGRIEELRWRLRFRTEQRDSTIDEPTATLVPELLDEVTDLIRRVEEQIKSPDVQALGLQHRITLGTAVETSASIATTVIHAGAAKSSSATGPDD